MDESKLIFDIGMYNGDDTAFYLFCGYQVVAVEANPTLILEAQVRFKNELQSGQLQIIPGAIADTGGTTSFWIDQTQGGTNSSLVKNSPRSHGQRTEIRVDTLTLADLIMQYGTPYYIKIDIEGAELLAVSTLLGERPPQYLSAEINNDAIFPTFDTLGYKNFQVIDQAYIHQQSITIEGRPWQFSEDSSGPFGEQLPAGEWVNQEEAKHRYQQLRTAHPDGWFDLHGRL